jgi:hypothetical protein
MVDTKKICGTDYRNADTGNRPNAFSSDTISSNIIDSENVREIVKAYNDFDYKKLSHSNLKQQITVDGDTIIHIMAK